jgi:dienelactone hydrolase
MASDDEGNGAGARATFAKKDSMPHAVTLEAEPGRLAVVSGRVERLFHAPGTMVRDAALSGEKQLETAPDAKRGPVGGRVGRLFLPPSANQSRCRLPAVIVLSGSGGGFDLDKAAVLSRHGFATLALAYFGIRPLPTWLHRVPLEYVESALGWLAEQPEIDPQRIAMLGVSRGSELALIAAARFAAIRAVVAYAPSSVAWDSGGREKSAGKSIPAWLWHGQPIASAPLPLRGFVWRSAFPVLAMRRPVMFRNLFLAGLRNSEAVAQGAIPVEQVKGPMLLISGGDDHVWPAEQMAEAIVARLKKHSFGHAVEHLHYPSAGHLLRYPHLPTTARGSGHEHLRGARLSFGGSAQADAEAQADSWQRSIAFLKEHL